MTTIEELFAGQDEARQLFDAVQQVVQAIGPVELKVSKSQVAFYHRRAFAWVWRPGQYLSGKTAPLVLTIGLRRRDGSQRWKEVVEPYPGRFTHHLELYAVLDVDDEVRGWLQEAYHSAGLGKAHR